MKTLPVYQVDAFTSKIFSGNPAAVVPLEAWLPDDVLLNIAKEHNQSETAFFVPVGDGVHDYELRWFTPAAEIDLCGHATLASSFVIFNELAHGRGDIKFKTRFVGDLSVKRDGAWLELDFPVREPVKMSETPSFLSALNVDAEPIDIVKTPRDWYIVYDSAEAVRNAKPDMDALAKSGTWQCITARGEDCDFVSRFFTASDGMNEDPVTGSTHCALIPYWAKKLGKTEMTARQLSARGGFLKVALVGDRVKIAGQAVLYSKGQIYLRP